MGAGLFDDDVLIVSTESEVAGQLDRRVREDCERNRIVRGEALLGRGSWLEGRAGLG